MKYPESPEEWREAVAAAVFAQALDAAWQYGLIEPDPCVDLDRCDEVLDAARSQGIRIPTLEEVIG